MRSFCLIIVSAFFISSCSNTEDEVADKAEVFVASDQPVNGKIPDGDFSIKYPDGTIKINGQMLDNKRVGGWTSYYESGVKQSETTYKNGILNGKTASFYANGQVRYIGYYMGGKKEGKWEFYNEDGTFEKSELFVKGKLRKE